MKVRAICLSGVAFLVGSCGDARVLRLESADGVKLTYQCSAPVYADRSPEAQTLIAREAGRVLRFEVDLGRRDRVQSLQKALGTGDFQAAEHALVQYGCAFGLPPMRTPRFPEPGSTAPEYTLSLLPLGGAESFRNVTSSDARGWPVILTFWSTWCGPCRDGYSDLQALAQEAEREDVLLYVIVHRDSRENVQRWISEHGGGVRFAFDAGGRVAEDFGVRGIPSTFVIGPNGQVRAGGIGYAGEESMMGLLKVAKR